MNHDKLRALRTRWTADGYMKRGQVLTAHYCRTLAAEQTAVFDDSTRAEFKAHGAAANVASFYARTLR